MQIFINIFYIVMYLGNNIKKIRTKWKIDQEPFAERLGLTRQQLGNYELNTSKPSLETIFKIEQISGLHFHDLYSREILDADIPDHPGQKKFIRPEAEGTQVAEQLISYEPPLLDDRALRDEIARLKSRVDKLEQQLNK